MKQILLVILASMALTGVAHAAGDVDAGKSKVAACAACHGQGGNSASPAFPKLAGQNARYLIKQMEDIQCGGLSTEEQAQSKCTARNVPTMAGQLNGKSAQDLADIAAYYASQTQSGGQANEALAVIGEKIYRGGLAKKGVAACTACHSPTGKGNAPAGYPALAGQHADYIATQLRAFRDAADYNDGRGRSNDGDTKIMRDIAFPMSNHEIEAVASYISGLH
jgi:cytochrome c553